MAFEALSLMTKNQVVSFITQVERGKKSLLQRYFEGWWQALIPALVSSSSSDAEGEERPLPDDDSSDSSGDELTRRLIELVTVMSQSGGLHSAAKES